eukprot:6180174-Prorocentrum_lima.AAC.1
MRNRVVLSSAREAVDEAKFTHGALTYHHESPGASARHRIKGSIRNDEQPCSLIQAHLVAKG